MSGFGYPFNMGNGMMCYKERYPLLLEWFITFIGCIKVIGGALHTNHCCSLCYFYQEWALNCREKSIFGYLLITGNGMPCCKKRYPLLFECLITFLRCMVKMGDAYDSTYKPLHLLVLATSFLPRLTLELH